MNLQLSKEEAGLIIDTLASCEVDLRGFGDTTHIHKLRKRIEKMVEETHARPNTS